MKDIKPGMRVCCRVFNDTSFEGLNLRPGEEGHRRDNAKGVVESEIAGSNGGAFKVLLDTNQRPAPFSRQQQAQENPAVEKALEHRRRLAVYVAGELTIVP